MQHRW